MRRAEAWEQEVKTLRERLSRLSEASLRINETLDFETVLGDVLNSARVQTGSRYGVMTLRDSTGEILDCVASGMTPDTEPAVLENAGRREVLRGVPRD